MTDPAANIDDRIDAGLYQLQNGDAAAAESIFRSVLAALPDDAETLTLLGVSLQQQGRSDQARAALEQAVVSDPAAADAHYNLAEVLAMLGELSLAQTHYQHCVDLEPDNAIAWRRLGDVRARRHDASGAAAAAGQAREQESNLLLAGWAERMLLDVGVPGEDLSALRQAAEASPDDLDGQVRLYRAAARARDLQTFDAAMAHALRLTPDDPKILGDRVNLLLNLGEDDRAIAAARGLTARFPDDPASHIALVCACLRRNDPQATLEALRPLVRLTPDDAAAHFNLGQTFTQLGRTAEAEAALRRTIELRPDSTPGRVCLSVCLENFSRHVEAVEQARRAVENEPDSISAINWLATLLTRRGKHSEAAELHRRALEIAPRSLASLTASGMLMFAQTKTEQAWALMRQAMAIAPQDPLAIGAALFFSNGHPDLTPGDLYDLHRTWARLQGRKTPPPFDTWANTRDPGRRLRIGYLTPDARAHSVSYFLEPLLSAHDRSKVEVLLFDNVIAPDPVTEQLRKLTDGWHRIVGMEDGHAASLIRDLRIDILVDLAGHTSHARMAIFARHPAPVQASYLGYPNTTGLPEMDYRITDAVADPPGDADLLHSERLVRLPGGFLCFNARAPHPDVGPLPAAANGFVTFGSFNASHKINRKVIAVWSELLKQLTGSRVLFKAAGMSDPQTQANIAAQFATHGVTPDRLSFLERTRLYFDHLDVYNRCDIALDTFPYNGTTTTCEAVFMGVPVITFAGDRHAARVSASILTRVGLTELIGDDAPDMIDRATRLARDLPRLERLRADLRGRMKSSRLMDARALAGEMEVAYRRMWLTFCSAGTG